MKVTKKLLKQLIREELSNTLKLKESISVEAWDNLRSVLESNQEIFRLAYQDLINSHRPDQIDADTGEPVDSDPHTEAMKQIVSLIEPYLMPGDMPQYDDDDVYDGGPYDPEAEAGDY